MTKKKQQFDWPMFVRAEDYPFRAHYVQYPIIDGKISDHANAAGESLCQRTIEDAIEDMHNEARERSSFYRNRHLFVQQRSKRKILRLELNGFLRSIILCTPSMTTRNQLLLELRKRQHWQLLANCKH